LASRSGHFPRSAFQKLSNCRIDLSRRLRVERLACPRPHGDQDAAWRSRRAAGLDFRLAHLFDLSQHHRDWSGPRLAVTCRVSNPATGPA
jgi:hypothetical protein